MKFSFVIPAYKNYKLLHQLLFDIYKNCSPVHEIIITEDGGDNETKIGVNWWTGLLPVRHFVNEKPLGFLKNSNNGLTLTSGDILCLVSTDVRIYKDIVKYEYKKDTIVGGRYLDWDTGWNTFNKRTYPYLEGWLLCASSDNWNELEGFDDIYYPNDMEDVDLSTYALARGWSLDVYPDGYVSHIGAQSISYGPDREKITLENKKKFQEKWITE